MTKDFDAPGQSLESWLQGLTSASAAAMPTLPTGNNTVNVNGPAVNLTGASPPPVAPNPFGQQQAAANIRVAHAAGDMDAVRAHTVDYLSHGGQLAVATGVQPAAAQAAPMGISSQYADGLVGPAPDPATLYQAISSHTSPSDSGHGILWGQMGRGAAEAGLGALGVWTGAGLSSTLLGSIAGIPMAAFGVSDGVQGATMMRDAYEGRPSEGFNLLKRAAEKSASKMGLASKWGDVAYDAAELVPIFIGALAPERLTVVPDIINRTESLFGVKVRRMDNSVNFLGKILNSNSQRTRLITQGAAKVYHGYRDGTKPSQDQVGR